mmetsp:Transcript_7612/g.12317  ORF Transcript_7612/g.12317 Transcript_7612/m.12317 type:complete len:674 (+) Transcript_7612:123-2144(+)|eukprot:CAMPEP_0203760182 /NCGR_PEP_ID=MMETSP0098-20131031/13532_1 /ASSEMBLY_ACC=CAM_ASM_000208 /TAXON_ID=96639 /ORGANISM=" , Strain NY0313808BC1" /LENGTH=673 /DNA_ID=CAMNT_0050653649 /DNA_START=142 /DNA_END=2163 /DNA_ORIENTATION=-
MLQAPGFPAQLMGALPQPFLVVNPHDREVIPSGLVITPVEVIKDQFISGKRYWKAVWSKTSLEHRKAIIEKFKHLIEENTETLAKTMAREMGKPIKQGRGTCAACGYRIDYFLGNIEHMMQDVTPNLAYAPSDVIKWESVGICGFMYSFNFPVLMLVDYLVPAILTGNCILLKPSEYGSMTAALVVEYLLAAGCPKFVVQMCIGGPSTGTEFSKLNFDSFVFIGSTETGHVIERNSPSLRHTVLQLGGNDAIYVAPCCDLDFTVNVLVHGAFDMMGENCDSVERIFIHEDIFDIFVERFVDETLKLNVGNPLLELTDIGPLFSLGHTKKMEALIIDAVKNGGVVKCGFFGGRLSPGFGDPQCQGFYFPPTVVVNCNNTMRLVKEETFGPVVALMTVTRDLAKDDIIAELLESDHGLTAGVFSRPDAAGRKLAARILEKVDVGTVYWNKCGIVQPWLPWTGRRASGRGTMIGEPGIKECFLRTKSYLMDPDTESGVEPLPVSLVRSNTHDENIKGMRNLHKIWNQGTGKPIRLNKSVTHAVTSFGNGKQRACVVCCKACYEGNQEPHKRVRWKTSTGCLTCAEALQKDFGSDPTSKITPLPLCNKRRLPNDPRTCFDIHHGAQVYPTLYCCDDSARHLLETSSSTIQANKKRKEDFNNKCETGKLLKLGQGNKS